MAVDTKSLAQKYKVPMPTGLNSKDQIMVVEDQTDLRLIVTHQLKKLNFSTVRQCANGYEAVEVAGAEENTISAYICDIDMPIMNGIDFLQELRENPNLDRGPFCLTMDNVDKEKIMLAVENGVDEILVKPFTLGDIGPKLRNAFKKFHNPNNPEKVYELAKISMREGKFDLATSIYKDLATAAPKAARPLVGLARVAVRQGDFEGALNWLAKAEKTNKNFVHLYTERGEILAKQGKLDEAIASFRIAIKLSPLNALRYKAASDILYKNKRYEDAAAILEEAVARKLNFPDLYHHLSQAKFALKDYKMAAKYIRGALSSDAENVTYLNQLGICQKEMDLVDDATKTYNLIIRIDSSNKAALYNKAILLQHKGDTAEAVKILGRLLRKHPDFEAAKAKLAEYGGSSAAA